MAMSNCRECGKAVSTKAKTCPNCGAPKPAKKIKIKKNKKTVKPSKKSIKGKVWVHCSNKKCRDYTEMYQIKILELGVKTCINCGKEFKKAEMRDGRDGSYGPIMPSGGTYGHSYFTPSPVLPSKEDSPKNEFWNPKNEFWGWIVLIVFIFLVFAVGSTIDSVSPWKSLHGR